MTTRSVQKDSRGRLRRDSQTHNTLPSKTVQSDAHLADIGEIMRKFRISGDINLDGAEGMFLDVSGFTDFADVQRQTVEATAVFMKLPSKVREIFNHDVADWLDTAYDADKRERLVTAGFLEADQEEEVVVVPDVDTPVDDSAGEA